MNLTNTQQTVFSPFVVAIPNKWSEGFLNHEYKGLLETIHQDSLYTTVKVYMTNESDAEKVKCIWQDALEPYAKEHANEYDSIEDLEDIEAICLALNSHLDSSIESAFLLNHRKLDDVKVTQFIDFFKEADMCVTGCLN